MRNYVLVPEEKCFSNKKIELFYLHHIYNKQTQHGYLRYVIKCSMEFVR